MSSRVRRLAITSAWALGVIWLLWALTVGRAPLIGAALALGWILMPTVLWASLQRPSLRLGLIVPATLVTGGVAAIAFGPLPNDVTRAGWLALLAGLAMGGVQGAWLWFGWFPVPAMLRDPLAKTRMRLIVAHVSLVVSGMVLVAGAALT
jgi:hypothetical protein